MGRFRIIRAANYVDDDLKVGKAYADPEII
jgi:hypothetical protein